MTEGAPDLLKVFRDGDTCPWCEAGTITEAMLVETFGYLTKAGTVDLSATVPVWTCSGCGMQWTDYRGEDARTDAVNAFLAQSKEATP